MDIAFGCIVEGHGERESVPVLLRRIVQGVSPRVHVRIPHPIRISKGKLLRPEELERAVRLAALNAGETGVVLVVVDADTDCPKQLAPELLMRAESAAARRPLSVVLPKHEFENWLIAGAESLRGLRGLADDLTPPKDPEGVRGAKEWLSNHMAGSRSYQPTLDQAALAARLDLNTARSRSRSFEKFCRAVERLTALARP